MQLASLGFTKLFSIKIFTCYNDVFPPCQTNVIYKRFVLMSILFKIYNLFHRLGLIV